MSTGLLAWTIYFSFLYESIAIFAVVLPLPALLLLCVRNNKKHPGDEKIVLVKNADPKMKSKEDAVLTTTTVSSGPSGPNDVPENVPLAPPPKDPHDDTLRGVKSLETENSKSLKLVDEVPST